MISSESVALVAFTAFTMTIIFKKVHNVFRTLQQIELVQPSSTSGHIPEQRVLRPFICIPVQLHLLDTDNLCFRDILLRVERQMNCTTPYQPTNPKVSYLEERDFGDIVERHAWSPFDKKAIDAINGTNGIKFTVGNIRTDCLGWPFGEGFAKRMPELVDLLLDREMAIVNYVPKLTLPYTPIRIERAYQTKSQKKYPQIATYLKHPSGIKARNKLLFTIIVRPGKYWTPTKTCIGDGADRYRQLEPFDVLEEYMSSNNIRYGCVISGEFLIVARYHPHKRRFFKHLLKFHLSQNPENGMRRWHFGISTIIFVLKLKTLHCQQLNYPGLVQKFPPSSQVAFKIWSDFLVELPEAKRFYLKMVLVRSVWTSNQWERLTSARLEIHFNFQEERTENIMNIF